tara:strand:- start:204 stop:956 length:753 start_codon:yes stop_codon:yes gene_type:complete
MKSLRSNFSKFIFSSTVASLLFVFSGCSTTWVQKSPDWKPTKSTKVLLGHYGVNSDAGVDLRDLAKQAGGGVSFADMSLSTYKLMAKSLEKYNLSLSADRNRSEKLEYINLGTSGSKKADELLNTILAAWTHPEGANYSFTRVLNSTSFSKDIANTLKGNDKQEVFLSANLRLIDESKYLFFRRFIVILSIKVLNQNGDAVFQARTEGLTDLNFGNNPISEGRIEKALANALANMNEVEIENEISTLTTL